MNKNDASAVTGRLARHPFAKMLLMALGILLSVSRPGMAAPGNGDHGNTGRAGGVTFIFQVIKDYSVAPGGTDILEVSEIPALPPNALVSVSVGGSSSSGATTDASGNAYFYLKNSTPGTITFTFTDASGNTANYDMHFIAAPGPPTAANSFFGISQNDADADGVAQDQVTAYLFDQYGNPVPNGSVVWSITSGSASFVSSPNTTTSVGGVVSLGLTDLTAETADVQAVASYTDPITHATVTFPLNDRSSPPNNYLALQFVQPQPDLTLSYIVAIIPTTLADGTSQDEVEAMVYDKGGVPIPSGTITFTILTGTATIVTTTNIVNGVATAFFSSSVVGSVQVQAQVLVNGNPQFLHDQANPLNPFVTIQFTLPPPNLVQSYITPVIPSTPADGASKDEVEAYVVASGGAPYPDGTVVTFTISPATPTSGTAVIVQTTTTSGGIATCYLTNTQVGSVNITATVMDGSGNTYTLNDKANPAQPYSIVQFTNGPVDPSKSYIVVTQDNAVADGTSQDIVTAYLFDAQGRAITDGTTVQFSVTPGTATPTIVGNSNPACTTGSVTTSYVSTGVGAAQVQAQVTVGGVTSNLTDQANPSNNYVTIHFVVGQPVPGNPGGGGTGGNPPGGGGTPPSGGNNPGPGSNSGFTVLFIDQDNRLADGSQQDSIIAYISDAYGHPVPGVQVTFFIQTSPTAGTISSGAQFVGSPVNVTTDASGMARIAMTSTTAGTVFVDATIVDPVSGNTVLVDGSYQIAHFLNQPDVHNPLTTLSVVIYEALADGSQQTEVKAHIVDLNGDVMPGQDVIFSIDSGSGTIVTPQPVQTDANGDAVIYITSKTPGYVLITATVDGTPIINGSPARVQFAAINIYVPRVFTPNGDGTNDVLKPILVGISTFHYFSVYNRWGNLIFTTQDPNQGWDGTFRGVPQPVETYLWIGEGIDTNGRKIVQKGMVSLVR